MKVCSLSYSSFSQFRLCPEALWLKVHRAQPSGISSNLLFGSGIHVAAAYNYLSLKNNSTPLSPTTMLNIFNNVYEHAPDDEVIYSKTGSREKDLTTAMKLLKLLSKDKPPHLIVGVEHDVTFQLRDLIVIGRLDLLERDENGQLVIWDLKTARSAYNDDDKRRVTEQLALYAMAFQEPVRLKIKVFIKATNPRIEDVDLQYSDTDKIEVSNQLCAVRDAIVKGARWKNRSYRCDTCPYSHICIS